MASPIREGASFKVDGGKYAGESGVVIGATVRISPRLDITPWKAAYVCCRFISFLETQKWSETAWCGVARSYG